MSEVPCSPQPRFAFVPSRTLATGLACFALLCLAGCNREHGAAPKAGGPLVARGMTLSGESLDLGEDYAGKAVLVNVWASWCGPCKMEMPELKRIHARFGPRGLAIVGVNVDSPGQERGARAVKKRFALPFPSIKDPSSVIAGRVGASALPTSVLLNRQHKVVWRHQGLLRAEHPKLNRVLEEVLAPAK